MLELIAEVEMVATSPFGRALCQGGLDTPRDAALPGAEHLGTVPHVSVTDEAFPLQLLMMELYPGQNLCLFLQRQPFIRLQKASDNKAHYNLAFLE